MLDSAAAVARVVVVALLAAQLALTTARIARAPRRSEAVWFLVFLAALVLAALAPGERPLGLAAGSVLLWAAGSYLPQRDGQAAPWWWHAGSAALLAGVWAAVAAGIDGGWWWLAPVAAVALVQVMYPFRRLCAPQHLQKGPVDRYLCVAGLLPVVGMGYDQLAALGGAPAVAATVYGAGMLALGSGIYLIEGHYLRRGQWIESPASLYPRRLQRLQRRLAAAEENLLLQNRIEAVGYLTAGVVHELKNTLSLIKASAEFGLGGGAVDATRALQLILQHVDVSIDELARLLETVARGGQEQPEAVNLHDEMAHLLKVVASSLHTVRVRVEVDIPPHLQVQTRRRELILVLLNLIQNAAQVIAERLPAGGTVRVVGREAEGQCLLEVIDQAGGVDPQQADRIFEWGHSGGTGTGLGLFLSRRLVERNGGTLQLVPREDGSCFRVSMPRDS